MQFSIFLRISVQSAENKTCLEFNSTVICQFSLDERLSVAHTMIYWQIPAECQLCSRSLVNNLRDLFSEKESLGSDIDNFLGPEVPPNCPRLSDAQKRSMEHLISTEELTKYLKKTKIMLPRGVQALPMNFINFSGMI